MPTLESQPEWVKSSLSFANGNCVEVANLSGGAVGVRNSRDTAGAVLRASDEPFCKPSGLFSAPRLLPPGAGSKERVSVGLIGPEVREERRKRLPVTAFARTLGYWFSAHRSVGCWKVAKA